MKKKYELAVTLTVGKNKFEYYHQILIDAEDSPARFEKAVYNLVRVRFPVGSIAVSSYPVDEDFSYFPCSLKPYDCADKIAWGLLGVILGYVAISDLSSAGVVSSVLNIVSRNGK